VRSQNCEKQPLASSCLSFRPQWATRLPMNGFSWNFMFHYFSKIRRKKNSSLIEIWQEWRVLHLVPLRPKYLPQHLQPMCLCIILLQKGNVLNEGSVKDEDVPKTGTVGWITLKSRACVAPCVCTVADGLQRAKTVRVSKLVRKSNVPEGLTSDSWWRHSLDATGHHIQAVTQITSVRPIRGHEGPGGGRQVEV
jgi:hypothetical protein